LTFTLQQRPDGIWEARADPCAAHLADHHTTSAGFSCASSDRQHCIAGILSMFVCLMIAPLQHRGDSATECRANSWHWHSP
jgi:hypothetical protein